MGCVELVARRTVAGMEPEIFRAGGIGGGRGSRCSRGVGSTLLWVAFVRAAVDGDVQCISRSNQGSRRFGSIALISL